MSEIPLVSETPFALEGAATRTRRACLFLTTNGAEPCGVEIFTRKLVAALAAGASDAGCELMPISGSWRDLPATMLRIARAQKVVFSAPLVAWTRMLVQPLLLLLFAFLFRRRIGLVLHEWSALHPLRRFSLFPFVVLSDTILVLSPYIRAQVAHDRWIARAARKCRLIPHPPSMRRPAQVATTAMARQIETAAADCDIVIGSFGSIYRGTGATALLEICDHLRNRGICALGVFIGNFTSSLDDYERQFRTRLRELALERQVIITGYVATEDELFALFERVDVFLFQFHEGLTARRASVIACLQSDRPVIVSAPLSRNEFLHHAGLTALIERGALSFVPRSASADEVADQLLAAARRGTSATPAIDVDAWWSATTSAARAAL